MAEDSIWIVSRETVATSEPSGAKGFSQRITQKAVAMLSSRPVSPDKIQMEWGKTIHFISKLIQQTEDQISDDFDMQLDEVTMSVEIDSSGKVSLIGTCTGEASGKGAILLKFKKSSPLSSS